MGEFSMLLPDLEQEDVDKLDLKGFKFNRILSDGVFTRNFLCVKVDTVTGNTKQLVCKVADCEKMPKTIFTKFFLRELDVLSRIKHPYIISVQSVLQLSNKYFIFTRYAEMGDLSNYILSKGHVKEKHARPWVRQLASALQYLHTLGVAHRDVKCDNILITCNLNLKLSDFGFASLILNEKGKEVHSSTFCGSLSYAAPEVIRGTKYYPRVADIWSLGVVMFAMINGYLPFKSDSSARLYADQMFKNYNIRRDIVLSNGVKETVILLLEPDPNLRVSLEALLRCRWIRMVPKYRLMNEQELDALELARQARKELTLNKEPSCNMSLQQSTISVMDT